MLFTLENVNHNLLKYDKLLNGKFNYHRDDDEDFATIELKSLEEFNDFIKTVNCKIIVYQNNVIVIYDGYYE